MLLRLISDPQTAFDLTSHQPPFPFSGLAAIDWRIENGVLHLELTVPDGAAAVLDLDPTWKTEAPGKLPPGVHRFQAKRGILMPINPSPGIQLPGQLNHAAASRGESERPVGAAAAGIRKCPSNR